MSVLPVPRSRRRELLLMIPVAVAFTLASDASGQAASKPQRVTSVELKAVPFKDPTRVPLPVQQAVVDSVGSGFLKDPIPARVKEAALELDLTGRGWFETRIAPKEVKLLALGPQNDQKTLMFYRTLDTWFCAPGEEWRGKSAFGTIEILDADLDGEIVDGNDFIRVEDDCFARIEASHLIAGEKGLVRFDVRKKERRLFLDLTQVPDPASATPLQIRALTACNRARSEVGLAPLQLDNTRSAGCQSHAEYLKLNNYDYDAPWDGVGSHDQIEGKPGFTLAGREAARNSATSGSTDPAATIEDQMATMLHRSNYLGSSTEGFGSGVAMRGRSGDGYCVLWGPFVRSSDLDPAVVVPAPGQVGVPLECHPERPPVESQPAFYSVPRGFPVSVTRNPWDLKGAKVRLFGPDKRSGKRVAIPGNCFTPEHPVHSTRSNNAESAIFVADSPLERNTTYFVEFTAIRAGETEIPIRFIWSFTTGTGTPQRMPPLK